jgi:hypothetical protein
MRNIYFKGFLLKWQAKLDLYHTHLIALHHYYVQRFGGTRRPHLQGRRISQAINQLKAGAKR